MIDLLTNLNVNLLIALVFAGFAFLLGIAVTKHRTESLRKRIEDCHRTMLELNHELLYGDTEDQSVTKGLVVNREFSKKD